MKSLLLLSLLTIGVHAQTSRLSGDVFRTLPNPRLELALLYLPAFRMRTNLENDDTTTERMDMRSDTAFGFRIGGESVEGFDGGLLFYTADVDDRQSDSSARFNAVMIEIKHLITRKINREFSTRAEIGIAGGYGELLFDDDYSDVSSLIGQARFGVGMQYTCLRLMLGGGTLFGAEDELSRSSFFTIEFSIVF